jgi:hypothetical protein
VAAGCAVNEHLCKKFRDKNARREMAGPWCLAVPLDDNIVAHASGGTGNSIVVFVLWVFSPTSTSDTGGRDRAVRTAATDINQCWLANRAAKRE